MSANGWFPRSAPLIAVVATVVAAASAFAGGIDEARVRKAARVPEVKIAFGVHQSEGGKFTFDDEAPAPPREAVDPEALAAKEMKGLDDAERWLKIANEYAHRGDAARATESARRAIAVFGSLPADQRSDRSLSGLVSAVGLLPKSAETARVVDLAEADPAAGWRTKRLCGEFLLGRCIAAVLGRELGSLAEFRAWATSLAPETTVPKEAVALLDRSVACFDRAVELASAGREAGRTPEEAAEALQARTLLRLVESSIRVTTRDAERAGAAFRGMMQDVQRAAELLPDEPESVTASAFFAFDPTASGPRPTSADDLPEELRAKYTAARARLEVLAKSADRGVAARAIHGLAILRLASSRKPWEPETQTAVEELVRKAVATDPALDCAWFCVAGVMKHGERWDELAKWCEDRAKTRDSLRLRRIWAVAEAKRGAWDASEKQWRAALGIAPGDVCARIGAAVTLARRAATKAELDEAGAILAAVRAKDEASLVYSTPLWFGWMEATIVQTALAGDIATAESAAKTVLEVDPENPVAGEVLAAIGR